MLGSTTKKNPSKRAALRLWPRDCEGAECYMLCGTRLPDGRVLAATAFSTERSARFDADRGAAFRYRRNSHITSESSTLTRIHVVIGK